MPVALLSVYDKSGIVEFASALHDLGWELISSGGTARALAEAGLPVTDVAELTGFPAILGHRVVTLHPAVHAGLLADLDEPSHRAELDGLGYRPIALAVVNLYPFGDNPGIELIDVGGPTMVRAAAKNHAHVGVLVDPADYAGVLDELRSSGALSASTKRNLARTAFAHTAAYDAAIVEWLDTVPAAATAPATMHLTLERAAVLRYGENPHQSAVRYRQPGGGWWDTAAQHGGKEMSYLNVLDTEAAWQLVHRFNEPACVIVKHANPCGVAVAADIASAYQQANACDPTSAFGGIVACNRPLDAATAAALAPVFTEVVVAPGYAPEALTTLIAKANLRVLSGHAPTGNRWEVRSIDGGFLVQTPDTINLDPASWRCVTDVQPDADTLEELAFAWSVCAAVGSNAIVLTNDRQAFGIGGGQPNRADAARIAIRRADGRARGGVCASDAFFPFRDGLDEVAAAGVRAVIQPGGSVRDAEVIAAANEHGIAMMFTGERHFRH